MRLLRLRWKNINSLQGAYEIDFRDPGYTESGIFAIVGPTGSGKSSILDAVSLSLFGTTPRWRSTTRSDQPDMVMTKNTSECRAEAVFESGGRCYCSRWTLKRPRRGTSFKPVVELTRLAHPEDTEGEILAEKIESWRREVERILGLTFETFTRSMLLAQGTFAELLKASEAERAQMLERITGTEIYSRIGRIIFESARDSQKALEEARMRLEAEAPLDGEKRAEVEKTQRDALGKAAALKEERVGLQAKLEWRRALEKSRRELALAEEARTKARREGEAAKESERVLEAARAAVLPMEKLEALRRTEKKCAEQEALQKEKVRLLEACEEKRARGALKLREGDESLRAAEKTQEAFEPVYEAATEADREVLSLQKAAEANGKALEEKTLEWERFRREREQLIRAGERAKKSLRKAEEALETTQAGEAAGLVLPKAELLAQQFEASGSHWEKARDAEARARRDSLAAKHRAALADEALEKAGEALQAARRAEKDAEVRSADSELKQKILEMRRLSEGLWSERWALTLAEDSARFSEAAKAGEETLSRFAQGELDRAEERFGRLEEHFLHTDRHALSTEHLALIARQMDEVVDWSDSTAAALEADRTARKKAAEAQTVFEKAKAGVQEGRSRADLAAERLEDAQKALEAALGRKAADEKAFREALSGVVPQETLESDEPGTVLEHLKASAEARRLALSAHQKAEKAWAEAEKACALLNAEGKVREEALSAAKTLCEQARGEWQEAFEKRRSAFGDLDPKKQRNRLAAEVRKIRKTNEALREEADALEREKASLSAALAEIQKSGETLREELREAGEALQKALSEAGFESEGALEAAFLPKEEREALGERIRKAGENLREAEARAAALQEQFDILARERRTDKPAAELEQAFAGLERELEDLQKRLGALSEQLRLDDEKKRLFEERQKALGRLEEKAAGWQGLSAYAGDGKGKRMREAAQKFTFALLLTQANRFLRRIESRYRLEPSGDAGLGVAVRDRDLANTLRPSQNLSGGETFLVSLALALSLSQISSGKIEVDTLFLDEGFGSLDAVTLNRALFAIETIQRDSRKLIGLISHVGAVSERIPAHIRVRPKGGTGSSEVTGPGVRRLEE